MAEELAIMEDLREIESVTDINGCFLLRANDNAIIESTIPLKIHDDILWEIAVLRDTFQQFATGIDHGNLSDITLEADRGFIFVYNLPPHFILLAMGPKQINLSYMRLAMLDIIGRIKNKVEEIGETLLTAPIKEFAAVGADASIPTLVTAEGAKEKGKAKVVAPAVGSQVSAARAAAEARSAAAEARSKGTPTLKPLNAQGKSPTMSSQASEMQPEEVPTWAAIEAEQSASEVSSESESESEVVGEGVDFPALLATIKGKGDKEKYSILKKVFDSLKLQIKAMQGTEIATTLDLLKDTILDTCGTSLALFDISKNARDFKTVHESLSPQQVLQLRERIDNWVQRIIK
jgi:predicted regulator of Ras-like GTPase activity (Roadblock/LC7/MglB family)